MSRGIAVLNRLACQPLRRRLLAAAVTAVLAAGAAMAWIAWMRPPAPPAVVLANADPAVERAVDEARVAVRKSPRSAEAWGHLGMVFLAHVFIDEAEFCLARAARLDPQDSRWAYLLAQIVVVRNPDEGIPKLEHAAELAGSVPAPRLKLGEVLLEQGRLDEAERQFQAVLAFDPDNPRAELGLGRLAYLRGDWQASQEHLRRSAQRAPGVRATHAVLAEVYSRLGDLAAADEELRRANETTDELAWPDPYIEAVDLLKTGLEAQLNLANSLLLQRRIKEATALVEETVRSRPDSYAAHLAYGRVLAQAGNLAQAEHEYREAVRLAPDVFQAQVELGKFLQRQKKLAEAAACFRRAAQLKPQDAVSYYHLGLCLRELGDPTEARQAVETAVRCKPDYAEAHRDLGALLIQTHEMAAAAEHLQYALQLAPRDEQARKLLAQVRDWTVSKRKP
jgi:tetratricopeptide (TPR) repeat protein